MSMMFTPLAGCTGETDKTPEVEDFEPADEVMTYPPSMTVSYGNKRLILSPYDVSWAYAIDEKEWCSVKSEAEHPIDRDYKVSFEKSMDEIRVRLSYPSSKAPDSIVYVHRYPIDLWVPEETEEGLKLKERIERKNEYEMFEECKTEVESGDMYYVYFYETEPQGYVYDVEAVWDSVWYRGTAKYSFIVK